MKKLSVWLLASLAALTLAGCASDKAPAEKAVADAETAMAQIRDMAQKYAPDQLQAVDPKARIVVLGDLNDFEFSQTADLLVGSGSTALVDLPRTLPVRQRYSYVFQGNSQVLDQIMVSPSIRRDCGLDYDSVHINSEFHDQISDHDPQVLRFHP